jgi:hypothetical protein
MTNEQLQQIVNSAMFGAAVVGADEAAKKSAESAANDENLAKTAANDALANVGLDPETLNTAIVTGADQLINNLTGDQKILYQSIQQSVQNGFSQLPSWYTSAPTWWESGISITADGPNVVITPGGTRAPSAGPPPPGPSSEQNAQDLEALLEAQGVKVGNNPGPGDTTSSRLAATMASHARFNGMIAGKRAVTSSLRSWGLGSINSDHASGNAYDLTGQNLGAYQKLVNDQGGFAEFHSAGGRHLHVVPGPGVPAGDSATPAMSGVAVSYSGPSNPTYNITVNGANASPEQIAMAVMAKIEAKQRTSRERS